MNATCRGQWKAFYKAKYDEWHVSMPAENSTMRIDLFPNGVPGDTPEEREFLAKLIAAAPELHDACKEFVRKVECGEARSTRSYAQMKAAISKAERGES